MNRAIATQDSFMRSRGADGPAGPNFPSRSPFIHPRVNSGSTIGPRCASDLPEAVLIREPWSTFSHTQGSTAQSLQNAEVRGPHSKLSGSRWLLGIRCRCRTQARCQASTVTRASCANVACAKCLSRIPRKRGASVLRVAARHPPGAAGQSAEISWVNVSPGCSVQLWLCLG